FESNKGSQKRLTENSVGRFFFEKRSECSSAFQTAAFSAVLAVRQKAKDFADRKSGQKTAKKAKKHIAGKNWKEYDRYRRKNRKEALTFQQKHVEFRYTKESDWSWLHESA
ncbi:MAG: hypothetical protein ACLRZH_14295, partial [Ruthenibacterium lactatiformans]